jgi:hypothetical protein
MPEEYRKRESSAAKGASDVVVFRRPRGEFQSFATRSQFTFRVIRVGLFRHWVQFYDPGPLSSVSPHVTGQLPFYLFFPKPAWSCKASRPHCTNAFLKIRFPTIWGNLLDVVNVISGWCTRVSVVNRLEVFAVTQTARATTTILHPRIHTH